jgi:hypothetical protein
MPALTPEETRTACIIAVALGGPCPAGIDAWGRRLYKFLRTADVKRAANRRRAAAKRAALRPRA